MILNLDKNFKPIVGKEIEFESFLFSGGEPHIRIKQFDGNPKVTITQRINSFNDLGLLCIATDALRRLKVKDIEVYLPYFPGARQDRLMVTGESLTVKVYADIINKMNYSAVHIFDPHSDVTPALIDNCEVLENHTFINQILTEIPKSFYLISPDAGAAKKIHNLSRYLEHDKVLECGKSRDVATGKLSGFIVPIDDLKNQPCLIVDDICDGGGTFMGLGKELKQKNAGKLYLAVSHGIFSKGTEALTKLFDRIFTTNSFQDFNDPTIHQVNISQLIKRTI